jgi:hypothetical protein
MNTVTWGGHGWACSIDACSGDQPPAGAQGMPARSRSSIGHTPDRVVLVPSVWNPVVGDPIVGYPTYFARCNELCP